MARLVLAINYEFNHIRIFTMKNLLRSIVAMISFVAIQPAYAAIITHSTDFIADGMRANFNGFEGIPNNGTYYTGGSGPYSEGGITVQQINSTSPIWIGYNFWAGTSGNVWYPNGGDFGYTKITLTDGTDFSDVGFNLGSGGNVSLAVYELYDNGVLVLAGTSSISTSYLGFSGGGFDTILVRDNLTGTNSNVANGESQALAIDSIETQGGTVPEPATLGLLGLGLAGLYFSRRVKV